MLGPLEQIVMDSLWQHQPQTVRDLVNSICQKRPLAYTTIQTVVTRLCCKGLVRKTICHGQHRYTPTADKHHFLHCACRDTLRQFRERFGHEAVTVFGEEFANLEPKEK